MDDITAAQVAATAKVLQTMEVGPTGHVVIIGGLVPTLRASQCTGAMTPHAGTTDMDLVLDLVTVSSATAAYYRGITESLRSLELRRDTAPNKQWRWLGEVEGVPVVVELLCDVLEGGAAAQQTVVPNFAEHDGDAELAVLQMPHSEVAYRDREVLEVDVTTRQGLWPKMKFPVAGLGSWLILKQRAAEARGDSQDKMGKDVYDLVWLLQCLGTDEVDRRLRQSPLLDQPEEAALLAEAVRWVREQFARPEYANPGLYALRLEGEVDEQTARRDAVEVVARSLTDELLKEVIEHAG